MKRIFSLLFALVLATSLVGEAFAQRSFGRSGGFGGGRSSFGGGGSFGRSSGGSFFGGGSSRSSSGFSRPSSPSFSGPRTGSGSFGRSGSFGNSGRVNSSSANPSRNYGGSYGGNYGGSRTTIIYGGHPYYSSGGFWSGYALGTLSNPWTRWVPFHPGFYTSAPYYDNGVYYEGGFSFTRFIFGILVIAFIIWLLVRMFGGGGGKKIRYTNYR